MPDMTDILAAHHPKMGFLVCRCGWQRSGSIDPAIQHRAHVAAALETAGYGRIEGKTQWASQNNRVRQIVFQFNTKEAANKETARHPYDRTTVSRTVTAWKKET